MISPPLRFITLHGATGLLRWQAECVRALTSSGDAELVTTSIDFASPMPDRHTAWQRLYNRLVTAGLDALDLVEPPGDAPAVPQLDIRDSRSMGQIDFILDFSPCGVVAVTAQPTFGIWRIHLGDADKGELPGTRETACRAHTITVAVVGTIAADNHQRVVHHATIKTRRSHRATLEAVLREATAICLGACRRLRAGQQAPATAIPFPLPLPASGPFRAIAGQLVRSVRRATEIVFFKDIWSIGVLRTPVDALLRSHTLPTPSWQRIPVDGEFHADPFPVTIGDNAYLLFEKYDPAQRRGLIACVGLDNRDPQAAGAIRTAIDLGCHMSYPAVFHYAGRTYCTPETHVLGGLRIFCMGADPWSWTQVAHVLPDMPLIDATLVEHGGLWWLMATLSGAASDTDLHIWHAPAPFGPWTPHRLNPVKSDVGSSRPAGNIFRSCNKMYRPAQDCARGYGTAVVINQIIHLDRDRFVEIAVKRFEPGRDWLSPDGLHTFNVFGDQVVIDAKRRVVRGLSAMGALLHGSRG